MEEFEIETAKEKRKKKRMIMTLVFVLAVVAVVGTSFALWQLTFTQSGTNVITTGCLNLTLRDDSDAITLEDATPTADDEGKTYTPYTFTIENTCNVNTRYVINLESVSAGDKILADKYVKANLLKGDEEVFNDKLVDSHKNEEKVIEEAGAAYMLSEGVLAGKASQQFNLRLWMAEDTGPVDEVMNAIWQGKITITATYVPAVVTPTEPATMKTIAADYTGDIWAQKANITKIVFQNAMSEVAGATDAAGADLSSDNSGSIKAYLVPNVDDATKYTAYIQADGNIKANADSSNLFNGFSALTTIEGIEYLDLTGVTNASNMFNGCSNLSVTLTIPASLTTYDGMFTGAATAEGTTITLNWVGENTIATAIKTASTGSNITVATEATVTE